MAAKKSSRKKAKAASSCLSWDAYYDYLSDPASQAELSQVLWLHGSRSPFAWLSGSGEASPSRQQCEKLARGKRGPALQKAPWGAMIEDFLSSLADSVSPDAFPERLEQSYDALAWAHAAPALAQYSDRESWCKLLSGLTAVVVELIDRDGMEDLLNEQLVLELGLTLSLLFSSSEELAPFTDELRKRVSFTISDLTDGEGIPRAAAVESLRGIVASWIRVALLAKQAKVRVFDDEAQTQLEWLVRQSIVLSRAGGPPLFQPPAADAASEEQRRGKDFFAAALHWEQNRDDAAYAAVLLGIGPEVVSGRAKKRRQASKIELEFETPTLYSEWASLAVMRTGWDKKSPIVGVTFGERKLLADISVHRTSLICGDVTPFISIDGQLVEFDSDIAEVCWHTDDECEYLELEVSLSNGWRLQRQYLFGKDDRFLWIADVVLGKDVAEIDYQCNWPVPTCGVLLEEETRDLTLANDGKPVASVIPAAASEWRIARSRAELEISDNGLQHRYQTKAQAAYIPLFFDLDKRRAGGQRTWRQLTVAEQLEIMALDVAAGFRVQTGDDQWMFYRSLGPRGNRSLLGQNTVAEFLAGRFHRDGSLEEMVEVE